MHTVAGIPLLNSVAQISIRDTSPKMENIVATFGMVSTALRLFVITIVVVIVSIAIVVHMISQDIKLMLIVQIIH